MREARGDELLEVAHELVHALGRQIDLEQLDRDEPLASGIVRTKDGAKGTGANLVEHAKRTERFWRCGPGGFRVQ